MRPDLLICLLICLLFSAGFAVAAHAGDVYKCTNASGAIAFQATPCAAGDVETQIHLDEPPPPPAQAAPASDAAPQDTAAADVPGVPPSEPPIGPPSMFVCTHAEDGRQYMSYDGTPPVRMVPGGVLGMPGKSLADSRGSGVSAPGVRRIPVDASPQASAATDYVPVQDQCVPASPETTCAYLRDEYDKIHAKLRRAFKDEQAVLQPQLDVLDAQLDGC